MIGQDYFDLRSRLGSALFALRGLAADAAGAEQASLIDGLIGGLKDPFVFVVVGEVNVGKSTFLNALFGAEFSRAGVMPTTDKVYFFKHGPAVRRVPVSRTLEEVHVPVDFLKDFHVVDTPGTNSIESDHQEITERFVPMADLVIFVFSAMNPWGASAWQFLEKVHTFWMRNVIFVLQQSDLREPEEIASILAYMRQLCLQRFKREFPIFPVSAKKAWLARSSGLDRERLLADSGYDRLEQHISRTISGAGARLEKLAGTLRTAREMLAVLRAESTSRIANRDERQQILRTIEINLTMQLERTCTRLAPAVEATVSDCRRIMQEVSAEVFSPLDASHALRKAWGGKPAFVDVEKTILSQLRAASEERWERSAAIFEDDIVASGSQLAAQLADGLKVQVRDELQPDAHFWQSQRRRFVSRTGSVQQRVVALPNTEEHVPPVLAAARTLARWQTVVAVAGIVAAIAAAISGWWIVAGVMVTIASMTFLFLHAVNARRLSRVRREAIVRLEQIAPELQRQLDKLMRDETLALHENFQRVLQPLREKLNEQGRRHGAQHQQIENLSRTFDELEAGLRGSVTPPG